MKSIQTSCLFFLLAVIGFSLTSCEKEYVSELQTLTFSDMSFKVSGGIQEQVFTNHDLSNYSIKSSDTWLMARIDVEHSTIYLKADENTTYDSRSAKVTISDFKDGVSTKTFNVTQEDKKGLIIDKDKCTIGMEGGEVSVTVNKNVDYDVTIPTDVAKWVSVVNKASSRGLEPSTLTLKVELNRSGAERIGTIKISNESEGLQQTFTITQTFEASFSVTPLTMEFDELKHDTVVMVHANFTVYPYCQDSWVTYKRNGKETDDDFTYSLYIQPFYDKAAKRTTTFVVDNTQVGQAAEVKITQYRTLYFKSEEKVIEVGQYLALEGDEEVVNTREIPVIYESTDTTVATITSYGRVTGVGEGYCTITVSSEDGKYKDYMYITVNKAFDIKDYITASWALRERGDSVYAIKSYIQNNSSNSTIRLKSHKLYYNDGKETDSYPNYNNQPLNAGEKESTDYVEIHGSKNYWVEWVFTYDYKDYLLKYEKGAEKPTITEVTAATSRRATTRKAASRRRR